MTSAGGLLRRSVLHSAHAALGARMVDFHGWELPIFYSGILEEHRAVRGACGLFDVSHMGQVMVEGPDALALLDRLNTNDVASLKPGQAVYSHLSNEKGGVKDDLIISCLGPERYLAVVNAATTDKDLGWLKANAGGLDVSLDLKTPGWGMLALQGPRAAQVLPAELKDCARLPRFGAFEGRAFGGPVMVTRTGYTGEDGFEIMAPAAAMGRLWESLLSAGAPLGIKPCGLGCRDTLRLEAGYLLYGQDIDEEHSSLEAGYGWLVRLDKKGFLGKEVLARQKAQGVSRRLAGVRLEEEGVPRSGAKVIAGGAAVGVLTSAGFSPTFKEGIGMGYFSPDLKPGDPVSVEVRGRLLKARVARLPFYAARSVAGHA